MTIPQTESRPKTVIVVPTIRETCIREFLAAWKDEFVGCHVIIVEDNPERTFDLGLDPEEATGVQLTHLCWKDIEADLGETSWIIPRRTDCVRSYGYWKAWCEQPDMIVTLDDDCFPMEGDDNFLAQHWERLEQGGRENAWTSTGDATSTKPRGIPYFALERSRPGIANHGLWTNVIDYDAPTQLQQARASTPFVMEDKTIPVGQFFPMCGMNLAFRPQAVPALYFLLMGRDYRYDRFGDIWAGVFLKKIADHLGWSINSGSPAIEHRRASSVWANLRKEAPGLELNERLWQVVDAAQLTADDFATSYRQLADAVAMGDIGDDAYFGELGKAMRAWAELFVPAPVRRESADASDAREPATAGSTP